MNRLRENRWGSGWQQFRSQERGYCSGFWSCAWYCVSARSLASRPEWPLMRSLPQDAKMNEGVLGSGEWFLKTKRQQRRQELKRRWDHNGWNNPGEDARDVVLPLPCTGLKSPEKGPLKFYFLFSSPLVVAKEGFILVHGLRFQCIMVGKGGVEVWSCWSYWAWPEASPETTASLPLIYVHGSSLNAEDDNFIKETILRKINI